VVELFLKIRLIFLEKYTEEGDSLVVTGVFFHLNCYQIGTLLNEPFAQKLVFLS